MNQMTLPYLLLHLLIPNANKTHELLTANIESLSKYTAISFNEHTPPVIVMNQEPPKERAVERKIPHKVYVPGGICIQHRLAPCAQSSKP